MNNILKNMSCCKLWVYWVSGCKSCIIICNSVNTSCECGTHSIHECMKFNKLFLKIALCL